MRTWDVKNSEILVEEFFYEEILNRAFCLPDY